jgi:hypothetical protein
MSYEIINSKELAKRWSVPESWIRTNASARVSRDKVIPHIKLGKYVRFEWGSDELEKWFARHRVGGGK